MKSIPIVFLLALTAPVAANPRPLPFSYPYVTLPEGSFEIEQHVDLIPVRVARELPDDTLEGVTSVRSQLTTELEYAVTDRLEVALGFAFRQGASAGTPSLRFQGLEQRVRYRFADAGEWPVDVGIYLEIAEFHDELAFAEKILLSRTFGGVTMVANLWVEQEYDFQTNATKHIYNPTVGGSYDVRPWMQVGAEYWARGRFDSTAGDVIGQTGSTDAPTRTLHYAGPTVMVQATKVWLSVGAYARLDNLGDAPIADDPYGKLWVRAIVGIDL
jgi:hypothetical protein